MEHVPSEIIAIVLSYSSAKQIAIVCRVCKVWLQCVQDYRICQERITSKIPHLRALKYENYTLQLGVAVEEKYLLVSGDCEDNLEILQNQFTQKGLNVDIYDTHGGKYLGEGYRDATLFTYDFLREYKAVFIFNFSMSFHKQTNELGDLLAEYIENGGGVVQCLYAMCSNCQSGVIEGKFGKGGYCPIYYDGQDELIDETELVRNIPDHFILAGVSKFEQANLSGYCPTEVRTEKLTSIVATFNDENETLAIICKEIPGKNKGRVCVLNFYPAFLDFDKTNAAELMVNAILYCGMTTNHE